MADSGDFIAGDGGRITRGVTLVANDDEAKEGGAKQVVGDEVEECWQGGSLSRF